MTSTFSKDNLYADPINEIVDFSFDEKTVGVFPDMINRSVPGYGLIQTITGLIATQTVRPQTNVYDLGCSLGASSLTVLNHVDEDFKLIAVDQSPQMIAKCQVLLSDVVNNKRIEFINQDITNTRINNASLVMLNLVLQFINPDNKHDLIANIYKGLNCSGWVILTEKVKFSDEQQNEQIAKHYHEFKRSSGYSELEIYQKRIALKNIMHLDTLEQHKKRLLCCGFSNVTVVFQALNFVTMVAIK